MLHRQGRMIRSLTLHGVDPEHVEALLKSGMIESANCGGLHFRLTEKGIGIVAKNGGPIRKKATYTFRW